MAASTSADRRRIAVVGGGVFGCTAALALSTDAHEVSLFERRNEILSGASRNNQNRLHLGFHYPRDLETARQCKAGFDRFVEMFPDAISADFPNKYFIASSGSLTTPEDYLRFCRTAGLTYSEIDMETEREVRNCDLGILCGEVVYDCAVLRSVLRGRLDRAPSIVVRTATEVSRIARGEGGYRLGLADGGTAGPFDSVVNCSYDELNRLTAQLGHEVVDRQFEYTVVPIVAIDMPRQGITILDGPFMTLLPHGKTSNYLLYHVRLTVVAQDFGPTRARSWSDPATAPFARMEKVAYFERMRDECAEFIPAVRRARLVGFLEGPRMVLARREHDDARPSLLRAYGEGYVTVFSGKIDHCTWVADAVRALIGSQPHPPGLDPRPLDLSDGSGRTRAATDRV